MKQFLGLIVIFSTLATQAGDLYVLDQQSTFVASTGLAVSDKYSQAQTFTCGIEGVLSRVDVKIEKGSATTADLVMSLWSTSGAGAPLNRLATISKPAADIAYSGFGTIVSFDTFSLPVTPGEILGIRLDSTASNASPYDQRYDWFFEKSGEYSGGRMFVYGNIAVDQAAGDYYFQTYVTPVPEPGVTALSLSAATVWFLTRKRKAAR